MLCANRPRVNEGLFSTKLLIIYIHLVILSPSEMEVSHFYAFWEGDKAPVWPTMEAMHAFVPGIEGIDLQRGYLEARICWWCSRCIGGFRADKGRAWGRERKLGFDLWVSLASGCLCRQCLYTRMNAQTCIHAQMLASSFYPSAFLAYLSVSIAHINISIRMACAINKPTMSSVISGFSYMFGMWIGVVL